MTSEEIKKEKPIVVKAVVLIAMCFERMNIPHEDGIRACEVVVEWTKARLKDNQKWNM